ncbi:MAG: DUF6491 family protein [Steroidobacteraceae bacterium]
MNTKVTSALVIITSLFAVGAQAEEVTPEKSTRECMFATQSHNWQVLDRQRLVLWGPSQNDAYLVTLFAPVNDLPFAETLVFVDSDHNGSICGGGFDKIGVAQSMSGTWPMHIQSMEKLDDAALLVLGEKYNVKLLSSKRIKALQEGK